MRRETPLLTERGFCVWGTQKPAGVACKATRRVRRREATGGFLRWVERLREAVYNTSMKKNTLISALLVVLILLVGAAYWAFQRHIITFEEGSFVPHFSKSALMNPVPSLERPINYPADFTQEAKDLYVKNVTEVKEKLQLDPLDATAWFDLAIYYRMVGDYDGAVQVWEYISNSNPSEAISLHNLGEHYFHEAKDFPKAEGYYLKSIAAAPDLLANYTDMHEMYKYVYKQNTSAAVDILVKGIENSKGGNAAQLKILLARHYRDNLNDKVNAKKYFIEARDEVQKLGNREVVNQLNIEISAL